MRRNQLYIPLFIATLAIVGSSCNDFLDELPDNRTELNSEQKIAKMLVSAYPEGSANELFELYSDNTDDNSARYSYYRFSTVWHNHLRNKHLTEHLRNNSNELATVRFSAFCGAMLSNNSFLMQR